MSLAITVLGYSGSYADVGGACSGYLVETDEIRLWVDCGPGTLANLQHHVELADLDAILVSHHHPDHLGELPVLYNAFKWYVERRGVPVYGPASVRHVTEFMTGHPTDDVFAWRVVTDGDHAEIGDLSVRFGRTVHTVENLAMRFEVGQSTLVYTGDTGPAWDMAGFAAGADLLVGEATVLAHQHHDALPHLSAEQLGARAEQAGVKVLLATHIQPGNRPADHADEASQIFSGRTQAPVIGHRYVAG